MDTLELMTKAPVLAVIVLAAIFLGRIRVTGQTADEAAPRFLRHIGLGATVGIAAAVIAVFALTALQDSGNGPLALIVVGPLAIAAGAIAGASIWAARSPGSDAGTKPD